MPKSTERLKADAEEHLAWLERRRAEMLDGVASLNTSIAVAKRQVTKYDIELSIRETVSKQQATA